jgi:hypothetical protein
LILISILYVKQGRREGGGGKRREEGEEGKGHERQVVRIRGGRK